MPMRKAKPAAPAETRDVNARGVEYKADKLTGNRAQRGSLPGGVPCAESMNPTRSCGKAHLEQ